MLWQIFIWRSFRPSDMLHYWLQIRKFWNLPHPCLRLRRDVYVFTSVPATAEIKEFSKKSARAWSRKEYRASNIEFGGAAIKR